VATGTIWLVCGCVVCTHVGIGLTWPRVRLGWCEEVEREEAKRTGKNGPEKAW